jgi:lipoprotein NlpI
LKRCLDKNPNVASVHYFMGVFARANGDEKAAINSFKDCVRLDPRHIDAARELRPK